MLSPLHRFRLRKGFNGNPILVVCPWQTITTRRYFFIFMQRGAAIVQKWKRNRFIIKLLNNNFISIKVDIEKQPKIAEKFNVFALPTTYFFSSKGEKIGSVPGYISKERLMKMLKKV